MEYLFAVLLFLLFIFGHGTNDDISINEYKHHITLDDKSSKYDGVFRSVPCPRLWMVYLPVKIDGKMKYCGTFNTEEDAARRVNVECKNRGMELKNPELELTKMEKKFKINLNKSITSETEGLPFFTAREHSLQGPELTKKMKEKFKINLNKSITSETEGLSFFTPREHILQGPELTKMEEHLKISEKKIYMETQIRERLENKSITSEFESEGLSPLANRLQVNFEKEKVNLQPRKKCFNLFRCCKNKNSQSKNENIRFNTK